MSFLGLLFGALFLSWYNTCPMFVILYLEINKTKQQPFFFLKESDFLGVVLVGWLYYLVFWNLCIKQFVLDAEKHGVISLPQWHRPNFWLIWCNKPPVLLNWKSKLLRKSLYGGSSSWVLPVVILVKKTFGSGIGKKENNVLKSR